MTTEQNALTNARARLQKGETLTNAVFGLIADYQMSTQAAFTIVIQAHNSLRPQTEVVQAATTVEVVEPPEWPELPQTTDERDCVDLSTADPDEMGLDLLDDNDIKLIDAIEMAKHRKVQRAADLPVVRVEPEPVETLSDFVDEDIAAMRDEALECLKGGKTVQEGSYHWKLLLPYISRKAAKLAHAK